MLKGFGSGYQDLIPELNMMQNCLPNTTHHYCLMNNFLETKTTKDVAIISLFLLKNQAIGITMMMRFCSIIFKHSLEQKLSTAFLKRFGLFSGHVRMHIRSETLGKLFKLAIDFNYVANVEDAVRTIDFGGATVEEALGLAVDGPIQAHANAPRDDRDVSDGWTVRRVPSRNARRQLRFDAVRFNYCQACGQGGKIIECDMCTFSFHRRCLSPPMKFDYHLGSKHVFACCALCTLEVEDAMM
eukprot:TRINITY_DN74638_c0_g1_i1.p1 TRINITY_DN74638_c0_g1~~TRINITY_DN74638_c0_g1_i1.p1  ORF type:complete len:242 (+),score=38.64 TRINITY_DN74638_c0_g1_i1:73-798(+)